MSEKKIDLFNVKVGDPVYTVIDGEDICIDYDESSLFPIGTEKSRVYFQTTGKTCRADKFPSCFHSRQEFLDFHAIAPVRMTEKELIKKYDGYPDSLSCYGNFKQGFLLAGGQIIEEPKNLPCVCGKEPTKFESGGMVALQCTNEKCFLYGTPIAKELWNDPSKRGGK